MICRSTRKEKQEREKEGDTQKSMPATPSKITPCSSVAATPNVSTPVSSPQSTPHAASSIPLPSFETPRSSRRLSISSTHASPASTIGSIDRSLDATALSNSSGLTPEVNRMRVSHRGRGRPRKIPQPPTYEDFPEEGTAEEKKKWKNRKKTEEWRYKKLTSSNADDFREKEKERVSRYVSEKRQDIIDAANGESTVYKHIKEEEMTPKSRAKEKSRKR